MADTETQKAIARTEVTTLAKDANALRTTVDSIDVVDEESCSQMGDIRQSLSNAKKKLDAKKKAATQPIRAGLKAITDLFAGPLQQIDDALEASKMKLDAYAKRKLEIERAEQLAAREAVERDAAEDRRLAQELREAGAAESADVIEHAAKTRVEQTKAPMKTEIVRGNTASVTTSVTWRARVYNVKDLCRAVADGKLPVTVVEVRLANLHALAREAKQAQQQYGVEFYEHVSSVTR